jgi:predicted enzyme related to lactoylglutathione lyase
MGKVTGIGGVFFRSEDPEGMRDWYRDKLGVPADQHGYAFPWREKDQPDHFGYTVWSPFDVDTDYFDPSHSDFMINFRVDDLDGLLEQLKAAGVEVVGEVQEFEYGRFGWVMDPEGNKVELWEPPADKKELFDD